MQTVYIETPVGIMQLEGDQNGISKSIFIEDTLLSITKNIPEELQGAVTQLKEYFEGRRHNFNLKLNPTGTDFQKKVWKKLIEISYGKTISYLELSKKIDDLKATRAVANANGKNILWIIIPCHRVIGSNGSLTGYAGKLWRKKWLLEHGNPGTQKSLFENNFHQSIK